MTKQNFDINKLRVASPCSVGWETMSGDERVRHCHSCKLNIYNIAEMTNNEVENLIANREGRLCIRLYKRADGTVLTKDCPVGFRVYQKRAARFAGAALTAVLGFFSISYGQKDQKKTMDGSELKIVKIENQDQRTILSGVLNDPNGAVVPGAKIKLFEKGEKKTRKTNSDVEGNYSFELLSDGIYDLEITSPGFKKTFIKNIKVERNNQNKLDIVLEISSGTVTVGIYAEEPMIDITSSSVTTTITRKVIDRLPH